MFLTLGVATIDPAASENSGLWSPWQEHSTRDGLAAVPLSHEPPPPGTAPQRVFSPVTDLQRRLFLEQSLLSLTQLQEVASREPDHSAGFPFLQLSLGDRLLQEGDEVAARRHWENAAAFTTPGPATDEAQRRLLRMDEAAPLQVGVLLPLSGKFANLGKNLLHAMQKALSDYRDTPIVLLPMDSGNDPRTSRAATAALAAQKVAVIIGPVFKEEAKAAVETALQSAIPILPLNPNKELTTLSAPYAVLPGRSRVVLNALAPDQQARFMARFARYQEKPRGAVLAPNSDYGHLTADAFVQEFSQLGGQITAVVLFPPEVKDLTPWIKSLKAAPGQAAPDALFMPTTIEQTRLILPQLPLIATGPGSDVVDMPLLLGTNLWNRNELLAENATLLIGAAFCDTSAQDRHFFRQSYRKAWGEDPAALAQLAYDGVAVLAQLLRQQRLGGPPWEEGFARPEGFRGSAGLLHYQGDGVAHHQYQVYQVGTEGVLPLPEIPELANDREATARPAPFDARSAFPSGR